MNTLLIKTSALCAALLLCGAALAQDSAIKKVDGVLVDGAGKTLYTFDKDTAGSGKRACNGPCATAWPAEPVMGAETNIAPPYSVVTRDDGTKQLAYNGKPLYLYSGDKKAGERSGDNFKDIWHVVK